MIHSFKALETPDWRHLLVKEVCTDFHLHYFSPLKVYGHQRPKIQQDGPNCASLNLTFEPYKGMLFKHLLGRWPTFTKLGKHIKFAVIITVWQMTLLSGIIVVYF